MREARGEAALHGAAEGVVGIGRERLRRERLARAVGELDFARRGVVAVDEERAVLHVEPAAEAVELDDEGLLRLGPAHARAQRGGQARMGDAHALVPEAAVAPENETEGPERRRAVAQSFSARTEPSAPRSSAPRKS